MKMAEPKGLFPNSWKLRCCFAIPSFPLHCGSSGAAAQTSRAKPCLLRMELLLVVFYKLFPFFRKRETLCAQKHLVLFTHFQRSHRAELVEGVGFNAVRAATKHNHRALAIPKLLGQSSKINFMKVNSSVL